MSESDIAIRVEGLTKIYRLGMKQQTHDSLGSSLADFIKSPLKNYRKYRSLYDFRDLARLEAGEQGSGQPTDVLWALRDVSFELKRGEALGIIGTNGAGKSTLLKVLSRITAPTKGRAEIRGRVGSLLEVGTGFHPELTGRENIYLNGTVLGMTKREVQRKFDEIVDFSGVEKFLDTPVKRYSSGMGVRLAFAVAAHLEPEILIVDEVLAVGDAAFQRKCLGKMEEVTRSGRTVLFVSHNMGAISNLCDTAIWLDDGRLVERGEVESLVASYLNRSTNVGVSNPEAWKREGTGEARITQMRLLDDDGNGRDTFNMGDSIVVEFDTEFFSDRASLPDDLAVEVTRVDLGLPVLHLSSFDVGFLDEGVRKGRYRFRVTIPNCVLYPGTYNVSVWVAGFDYVKDALSFHMLQSGVSKRTCPFYPSKGIYHSPSSWSAEYEA